MKNTPQSAFPLYESPRIAILTAGEILDEDYMRRYESVRRIERFARNLHRIATEIEGSRNRRVALDLIWHDRPYCIERRDGQLLLMDRSYEPMSDISFDPADIEALMLFEWCWSGANGIVWGAGAYPVIDDGFRIDWLPQAAGLVQRIARVMSEKMGALKRAPRRVAGR